MSVDNMSEMKKEISELKSRANTADKALEVALKTSETVDKLAHAVQDFVIHSAVSEVKEKAQQDLNHEIKSEIKEIKSAVNAINTDRARESQSRNWLYKNWPIAGGIFLSIGVVSILVKVFEAMHK